MGNAGNTRQFLLLVEVIEGSKFQELPSPCLCRGTLPSLSSGWTDGGADYRFCDPFTWRFIRESEVTVFPVLWIDVRRLGIPLGGLFWDRQIFRPVKRGPHRFACVVEWLGRLERLKPGLSGV